MIIELISNFFIIFIMGSKNLYFDLENDEVYLNYREHLNETSQFDTIRKFENSKITELTNIQDKAGYNQKRLKKILAFK